MPTMVGPIDLVILQSTGFCNMDCSYCYLPDRANSRQTMDLRTVAEVARLIFTSSLLKRDLDIVWHAGEPLSLRSRLLPESDQNYRGSQAARSSAVHYGRAN